MPRQKREDSEPAEDRIDELFDDREEPDLSDEEQAQALLAEAGALTAESSDSQVDDDDESTEEAPDAVTPEDEPEPEQLDEDNLIALLPAKFHDQARKLLAARKEQAQGDDLSELLQEIKQQKPGQQAAADDYEYEIQIPEDYPALKPLFTDLNEALNDILGKVRTQQQTIQTLNQALAAQNYRAAVDSVEKDLLSIRKGYDKIPDETWKKIDATAKVYLKKYPQHGADREGLEFVYKHAVLEHRAQSQTVGNPQRNGGRVRRPTSSPGTGGVRPSGGKEMPSDMRDAGKIAIRRMIERGELDLNTAKALAEQ